MVGKYQTCTYQRINEEASVTVGNIVRAYVAWKVSWVIKNKPILDCAAMVAHLGKRRLGEMKGSRPKQSALTVDNDLSKTAETGSVIDNMVDGLNDHEIDGIGAFF